MGTRPLPGALRSKPRRLWLAFEPLHAVVYFAPEVLEAYRSIGLKGFWMGYFAGRSAPFGRATPELVRATFFNFHESLVDRALPDAWGLASPEEVLRARLAGVDAALGRLLGREMLRSAEMQLAAELATEATRGCELDGRPMFAAHAALQWPDEPHLRLWHAATLLREHRGDGHVAALVASGLSGLDSHVTSCATGAVPRTLVQRARGWSDGDWDAAVAKLVDDGLLAADGTLSETGRDRRRAVEDTTDLLAAGPWIHLGNERTDQLVELLAPMAAMIAASGDIPFPNPMGLPPPPVR
jgi:hypothetical protein